MWVVFAYKFLNWDLSRTLFAQTKVIKNFAELFYFSALRKQMTDVSQARKEATEGTGRVALYSAFFTKKFCLYIAKLRFCLQNVVVKPQASFVGAPLKSYKSDC